MNVYLWLKEWLDLLSVPCNSNCDCFHFCYLMNLLTVSIKSLDVLNPQITMISSFDIKIMTIKHWKLAQWTHSNGTVWWTGQHGGSVLVLSPHSRNVRGSTSSRPAVASLWRLHVLPCLCRFVQSPWEVTSYCFSKSCAQFSTCANRIVKGAHEILKSCTQRNKRSKPCSPIL